MGMFVAPPPEPRASLSRVLPAGVEAPAVAPRGEPPPHLIQHYFNSGSGVTVFRSPAGGVTSLSRAGRLASPPALSFEDRTVSTAATHSAVGVSLFGVRFVWKGRRASSCSKSI